MKRDRVTIKDIYHCESDENTMFPLQRWYNSVIQKTEDELSILDVMHMFNQKMFLDSAIKKSIDYLKENPFVGELWEGQLIEKLAQEEAHLITKHSDQLLPLLKDAFIANETHEWEFEEWRREYGLAIKKLIDICQG